MEFIKEAEFKNLIVKHNLNVGDFYLICNGKKVTDLTVLTGDVPVHIYFRLPGGKGGFGSMLRAIGAQIEKTTNREACRDLSGRRIRDINEERRLKNWLSQKEEREREAKERRKQKLERMCEEPKLEFDDKDYEKQRAELTDNIHDSLAQGLKACSSGTSLKRSADKKKSTIPKKKRMKGLMLEIDIDSSSDLSDEENTHSNEFLNTSTNELLNTDTNKILKTDDSKLEISNKSIVKLIR